MTRSSAWRWQTWRRRTLSIRRTPRTGTRRVTIKLSTSKSICLAQCWSRSLTVRGPGTGWYKGTSRANATDDLKHQRYGHEPKWLQPNISQGLFFMSTNATNVWMRRRKRKESRRLYVMTSTLQRKSSSDSSSLWQDVRCSARVHQMLEDRKGTWGERLDDKSREKWIRHHVQWDDQTGLWCWRDDDKLQHENQERKQQATPTRKRNLESWVREAVDAWRRLRTFGERRNDLVVWEKCVKPARVALTRQWRKTEKMKVKIGPVMMCDGWDRTQVWDLSRGDCFELNHSF